MAKTQLEDRMEPVQEVLKTIKKMLADPNVKAVNNDNPICSNTTAQKIEALTDYVVPRMLYVQMFMQTETRNRLRELAEMYQKYRDIK